MIMNNVMDYFGARYYSSELSIWLSVDPLSVMYPSTSPYMYVRGNPIMLVDPDGRSDSKFGKWLKNIFKGEKQDPIKQRYKISGPTITATKTKQPVKKDGYIKTKFKQFISWLDNSHPFNEKGYGDPYYGAQKSGDPISNRNGDAGEMQTMPGGLIEINWPFKNGSSTQKDNPMLPYMLKYNNPIPKELVPPSANQPQDILNYTNGYGNNLTRDSARIYKNGKDTLWRTDRNGFPIDTYTRHRKPNHAYQWE